MDKYMIISTSVIEADTLEAAMQKLRDQLGAVSEQVTLVSISDELGKRVTIDPVPLWPPGRNDD